MDNGLDNGRCPGCGGLYVLMGGRVHRCSGVLKTQGPAPKPVQTATYLYRDPEKRRPQVAAAMRAYRQRKKHGARQTGQDGDEAPVVQAEGHGDRQGL